MPALLDAHERRALHRQRLVSRALSPLWLPGFTLFMYFVMRWRIARAPALRRAFKKMRAHPRAPLLICANHLTMADSFIIGWALGGVAHYLHDFGSMSWNTPERRNFADSRWKRVLAYILKCIPVTRGANRSEVARVLDRVGYLLARGETALIFPEGGRSRSGRVQRDSAAYGVGRLVNSVHGCRVLCVYARGEGQHTWSNMPARGERFRVAISMLEPKSDARGLRGSLDVAQQIVNRIAEMEEVWFRDRE